MSYVGLKSTKKTSLGVLLVGLEPTMTTTLSSFRSHLSHTWKERYRVMLEVVKEAGKSLYFIYVDTERRVV